MLRKSKALIFFMVCVMVSSFFMSFDSEAIGTSTTQIFRVTYPEPSTSESQGYFSVMAWNPSTGVHKLNTYFWNIQFYSSDVQDSFHVFKPYVDVSVSSSGITFYPRVNGPAYVEFQLCEFDENDQLYIHRRGICSPSDSGLNGVYTYNRYDGFINAGCIFGGNVGSVDWGNLSEQNNTPEVYFSDSVDSTTLYSKFYDVVNSIDELNDDVVTKLGEILTSTRTLESKLDDLIQLERDGNIWLEKIFNWLENSPEQEKEAAQSQANQSSSDAQSAIEDKGAGFVEGGALNDLLSYASTSSTKCQWTFPSLYLPEIPGVMARTQLTSEQEIDFNYWVNQIPENILLVVQSLLTVGLIIYCFKEFYGVIEYVLTMRGGGNSNE